MKTNDTKQFSHLHTSNWPFVFECTRFFQNAFSKRFFFVWMQSISIKINCIFNHLLNAIKCHFIFIKSTVYFQGWIWFVAIWFVGSQSFHWQKWTNHFYFVFCFFAFENQHTQELWVTSMNLGALPRLHCSIRTYKNNNNDNEKKYWNKNYYNNIQ